MELRSLLILSLNHAVEDPLEEGRLVGRWSRRVVGLFRPLALEGGRLVLFAVVVVGEETESADGGHEKDGHVVNYYAWLG